MKPTFTCQQTRVHLHRYIEDELDPFRSAMLERHLTGCEDCAGEKEKLDSEKLWLMESALETPLLSPRLTSKVMQAVQSESRVQRRRNTVRGVVRNSLRIAVGLAACLAFVAVGVDLFVERGNSPEPLVSAPLDQNASSIDGDIRSNIRSNIRNGGTLASIEFADSNRRPPVKLVSSTTRKALPAEWRYPQLEEAYTLPVRVPVRHDCYVHDGRALHSGPHLVASSSNATKNLRGVARTHRRVLGNPHRRGVQRNGHGTQGQQRRRIVLIRVPRVNLRNTVWLAVRMAQEVERDVQQGRRGTPIVGGTHLVSDDPCPADLTADGETKIDDIAYGVQLLYGAQPVGLVDGHFVDDGLSDNRDDNVESFDPDCDSMCARA